MLLVQTPPREHDRKTQDPQPTASAWPGWWSQANGPCDCDLHCPHGALNRTPPVGRVHPPVRPLFQGPNVEGLTCVNHVACISLRCKSSGSKVWKLRAF